jgi:hypothetical protein
MVPKKRLSKNLFSGIVMTLHWRIAFTWLPVISVCLGLLASAETYVSDGVRFHEREISHSLQNTVGIDITTNLIVASLLLANGTEKTIAALDGTEQYKSVMHSWLAFTVGMQANLTDPTFR